jgi:hypothetical protein
LNPLTLSRGREAHEAKRLTYGQVFELDAEHGPGCLSVAEANVVSPAHYGTHIVDRRTQTRIGFIAPTAPRGMSLDRYRQLMIEAALADVAKGWDWSEDGTLGDVGPMGPPTALDIELHAEFRP